MFRSSNVLLLRSSYVRQPVRLCQMIAPSYGTDTVPNIGFTAGFVACALGFSSGEEITQVQICDVRLQSSRRVFI